MSSAPLRLLLVEDNPSHVSLIERAFAYRQVPVDLHVAPSLARAHQSLRQGLPDLVLTDLRLPDGSGIELLPTKGAQHRYPVIVMTSHGDEQIAVEAMQAGALDYVVKSEVAFDAMPHTIERAQRTWALLMEQERAEVELRLVNQSLRREITERQRLEAQIRRHNEALEELVMKRTQRIQELERQRAAVEKLSATARLAAGIAHEINNPLASVMSTFELVARAIPAEHPRRVYVEQIEHDLDRVAQIIRQMYALHQPIRSAPQLFFARPLLVELATLVQARCEQADIALQIDAEAAAHVIQLPQTAVHQVLINLIQNALDAAPPGTTVSVRAKTDAERLHFSIVDEGPGIPEAHRDRIFEPFFTSKDTGRMGLGLSITQSLVGAMSGTITFADRPAGGTLFRVDLPRRFKPLAEEREAPRLDPAKD